MTIAIATIDDERQFNRYLSLRNAPRDTLVHGVHPNSHKALVEYAALLDALAGELSSMAEYHSNTVAAVAPFVAAMQAAMRTINSTMHIVNVLATAMGQDAIDTLTATIEATQQAAQALGGGQ